MPFSYFRIPSASYPVHGVNKVAIRCHHLVLDPGTCPPSPEGPSLSSLYLACTLSLQTPLIKTPMNHTLLS